VHLAAHPVSLPEFLAFVRQAGRDLPRGVKRAPANAPGAPEPVVGVSQRDAAAYCDWVCRREGRACRLPKSDELDALMPQAMASQAHGMVPDAGFWPHERGRIPELRGGLKPLFLCEWTCETEEAVSRQHPERVLAHIFYPPWLREGNNPVHAQAALLASDGYSFVTFRVSCEG
jgi:hypothetical protein